MNGRMGQPESITPSWTQPVVEGIKYCVSAIKYDKKCTKRVVLDSGASVKALSSAVRDVRQLIVDYRKSNNSLNTNVCFVVFY